MKKQIISFSLIAIGAVLGASALSVLAAGTWSGPACNPPSCNADTPINAGLTSQTKTGLLGLANLLVTNLNIASGTPAAGNVLISDASGNAAWGVAATSGSIPSNIVVIPTTQTWKIPGATGTNTRILVKAWGGGGGGGGATSAGGGGGGGGGGGYAQAILSLPAGTSYAITIGAGGTGGVGCTAAGAGGQTSFGSVVGNGGTAGLCDASATGISAAGGSSSTSGGLGVMMTGGTGQPGGSNATGGNGGDSPQGGQGGPAGPNVSTGGYGRPGITPGGGGGGSGNAGATSNMGGKGAPGEVIIEY